MYYVAIQRLNGRRDFYELANLLDKRGYDNRVEYFEGDEDVLPHLRFLDENDALVYCLTYGCAMSSGIPKINRRANQDN